MARVRLLGVCGAILMVPALLQVPASPPAHGAVLPYAFHSTQINSREPVRWNPCSPITYKINTNGLAGPAEVRRVHAAVAEAAQATGISIRYLGGTRFVPDDRQNPVPTTVGTHVVIAWAYGGSGLRRSALLSDDSTRRIAVGGYGVKRSTEGFAVARSGFVVFDAQRIFRLSARQRGVVALHELGHVLGLAHVADRRQVMYGAIRTYGPQHYAAGDLQGLRRVGRSAGCLVPPAVPELPVARRSGVDLRVAVPPVTSLSGPVTYTLLSPELGGQVAQGGSREFYLPLVSLAKRGFAGKPLRFRVRASNRVGSSVSKTVTYTVPPVKASVEPVLVASPSALDLVRPRLVLGETGVEVTHLQFISAQGSVQVVRRSGTSFVSALTEHLWLFSEVDRFEVSGTVTVGIPGWSQTFDVSGTYLAAGPAAEPDPSPEPTPEPTPTSA